MRERARDREKDIMPNVTNAEEEKKGKEESRRRKGIQSIIFRLNNEKMWSAHGVQFYKDCNK